MIKWIKTHKFLSTIVAIFLLATVIFLPFIIDYLHRQNPPSDFFNVTYSSGDILSYYGTLLSCLGTIVLGIITIVQTSNAQKKTDEVNRLNLELTKKSMAIAEKNYSQSKPPSLSPKFEIKNSFCNGAYQNLRITIKSVSSFIISNLKSVSFEVIDNSNNCLLASDNVNIHSTSLTSGQETIAEFHNKELCDISSSNTVYIIKRNYWKNIRLEWKFACEDEHYNTHYFKATLEIENTEKFKGDSWDVIQVG